MPVKKAVKKANAGAKRASKKVSKKTSKKVTKKSPEKVIKKPEITFIKGGVTAPAGFRAGSVRAGIKTARKNDLAIIVSDNPVNAAGVFTTNSLRAPSVERCDTILPSKNISAIICVSGCANACTGIQGVKDDMKLSKLAAREFDLQKTSVLTASTGVIGQHLPMEKITRAMPKLAQAISQKPAGGTAFAQAILTTDLVTKESAVRVKIGRQSFTIGAAAKGSGMIHPNMATMLVFITTDVALDRTLIDLAIKRVAQRTFNCLSVDGDTSTNDMVIVMANGASGITLGQVSGDFKFFEDALYEICNDLCKQIAADGEGATKRIEVRVTGARMDAEAQRVARAVGSSNLVKCAIFGGDPNWGRIACAIGNSQAHISRINMSIKICGTLVFKGMQPAKFNEEKLSALISKKKVVPIEIDLGFSGVKDAIAHGCDMSYDYVKINAAYRT